MFKFFAILSAAAFLATAPAYSQDDKPLAEAETAKIVPLLKMKKPELRIVYTNQSDTAVEDVVIANGRQIKPDVKMNDPVICRELVVPDYGKQSNGSRIRKTQKYCNHRSKWNARERNTLKVVKDLTGM